MSRFLTVSDGVARGRDNFLSLRHVLAAAVLVSHAYFVVHGAGVREPLLDETGLDLGQHAVNVFFALSGFLVVQSLERRGIRAYAQARALRLLPGLVAATLFTAFVIGPVVTTLPLDAYLTNGATWRFLVDIVPRFDGHATLPGVFTDQPTPVAMITIWTIKYEIACYALLAIGGAVALGRRARLIVAAAIVAFALQCLPDTVPLPDFVHSFARLGMCFAIGVIAWLYRTRIPLDGRTVLGLALLAVVLMPTPAGLPLMIGAECYGALWLAFSPLSLTPLVQLAGGPLSHAAARLSASGGPLSFLVGADFSYGIYLYGFPIEQATFWLLRLPNPWLLLAAALPAVLLVTLGSWLFIEKPALALKPKVRANPPAIEPAQAAGGLPEGQLP